MSNVKREGTAFIVVDAQNFILDEKGLVADWGVWKRAKETKMVENTKKAIGKARGTRIPIIYIRMEIRPQVLPAIGFWKHIKEIDFTKISPSEGEFQLGIVKELAPYPEDYIVTKYNTMDSFHNTDLEQILKCLKCDTLIFAGVVTNFCLETTVRSAFNRGYNTIVLSDCVATMNEEFQEFAIKVIFPMLGVVTTADELEVSA
ncbi:putative isochorismatase family protein [ANME-1 cluster archaeon GoMg2]|nr:putative isochorismatase family protein [ANME-1 cluster archaeon GoMg2]